MSALSSENDAKEKSETAEADPYLPRFLERYLPGNPYLRDAIMGLIWITLSSLLGILVVSFVTPWIGVVIMSIGIGYFTTRYWVRSWSRRNRESERR
jgi:hypothetical protein